MNDREPAKIENLSEMTATTAEPALEAKRLLVAQVLASRTFAKSARLSQFFEFVCSRALHGRIDDINEQQIGIHVFGRSPAYSATDDSIVRSQARLLRQRLEEYFEHECPACPLVIFIPKGRYVPVFEARPQEQPIHATGPSAQAASFGILEAQGQQKPGASPVRAESSLSEGQQVTRNAASRRRFPKAVALAAVGLLAVLLAGIGIWLVPGLTAGLQPSEQLWQSLFASGRSVVIVPSDDGLVLSEEMQRAPVSLDDYLSGDYLRHAPPTGASGAEPPKAVDRTSELTSDWLSSHQYTSTADLELAMRLSRVPQAVHADLQPRYARVLRLGDLKSNNVILIGGVGANPWVGLYAPHLNFDVNYDWKAQQGYVVNKSPRPGEQARYLERHAGGNSSSYGVLAYLPGITGTGSALLFEGSGMAGTEAAADFPFSTASFSAFIRKIRLSATAPLPYFEVLLETRSLGGNAPEAHVLAWRVIQP